MSTGSKYSLFPIESETGKLSERYFVLQETQLWIASEINMAKDHEEYPSLPPRYQEIYADLLAFFAPGDGLVSENVTRFVNECINFSDTSFFTVQNYIENVHARAYGAAIVNVIPDQKTIDSIIESVDVVSAVKGKSDYLKKYIESDIHPTLRFLAAACTEGIFFVSLFAIIFYMKSKNRMNDFIFLNEQVAKDEKLHRDYYCERVKLNESLKSFDMMIDGTKTTYVPLNHKELVTASYLVREAVDVEINHLSYILRKPLDSEEEDRVAGLNIDNLGGYVKSLANEIMYLAGLETLYENLDFEVPWMKAMATSTKTNFYEELVGNYRVATQDGEEIDLDNLEDADF